MNFQINHFIGAWRGQLRKVLWVTHKWRNPCVASLSYKVQIWIKYEMKWPAFIRLVSVFRLELKLDDRRKMAFIHSCLSFYREIWMKNGHFFSSNLTCSCPNCITVSLGHGWPCHGQGFNLITVEMWSELAIRPPIQLALWCLVVDLLVYKTSSAWCWPPPACKGEIFNQLSNWSKKSRAKNWKHKFSSQSKRPRTSKSLPALLPYFQQNLNKVQLRFLPNLLASKIRWIRLGSCCSRREMGRLKSASDATCWLMMIMISAPKIYDPMSVTPILFSLNLINIS